MGKPPAEPALRRIAPNKPNSSIADCGFGIADSERSGARRQSVRRPLYKQTQFAPLCREGRCRRDADEGEMRKTNPIPRLRIADLGLRIQKGLGPAARACGAGCTNKPNLPGYAGWDGAWGTGDVGLLRQTNPIWATARRMASGLRERSYD
jgi:hypothetical protein